VSPLLPVRTFFFASFLGIVNKKTLSGLEVRKEKFIHWRNYLSKLGRMPKEKFEPCSDMASEFESYSRNVEDIGGRIRAARDVANLSQSALSRKVGVSATTIQNYESGKFPKGEFAISLANALGCTLDWLLAGKGPMYNSTEDSFQGNQSLGVVRVNTVDAELIMVPMVKARLAAGSGSLETNGELHQRFAFRNDFLSRRGNPSKMVLMRVMGDSMEPEIKNNDTVLIDQSQTLPGPGQVFAVGIEDMVYLKMVDSLPGKIILKSFNPAFPPIEVDARGDLATGVRIIGHVVWVGRELP
jgi:phage repressor protein C with HTH and peptisase S24 domain